MPRTRRDVLKRKVAQVRHHINIAVGVLTDLHDQFAPVHPEDGQILETLGVYFLKGNEAVEMFYDKTWGSLPSDWDVVRTGRAAKKGE